MKKKCFILFVNENKSRQKKFISAKLFFDKLFCFDLFLFTINMEKPTSSFCIILSQHSHFFASGLMKRFLLKEK